MNFKVDILNDEILISLNGSLVEENQLPVVQVEKGISKISLNLKDLRTINSVGIKDFITWAHQLKVEDLRLVDCPPIFVQQMNLIANFLPAHARVQSFFAPYYSESLDQEKLVKYVRGTHFVKKGSLELSHPDLADGFELDTNSKYFEFLHRYG